MRITPNRYRSKYEEDVCDRLDKAKIPFDYETINLHYQITEQRKYIPDVILPNGIIIELKGRFTAKDRKKMLLVITQHPDLDIRMVFMRPNNRLSKTSKTTYAMWCDKNNVKWANKYIPIEWINE
tara:strand:- start:659 stop:1033 length:375 start_codon:yes stop_codon:yes gene_type:complete